MRFRSLLLSFLLLMGVACQTAAPTPMLIGRMVDLNDEVIQLYVDCSDGVNYSPAKEGCNLDLLDTKVDDLMELSLDFIKADIKQPVGYDIHLTVALIFFRISERNMNEYTKAEQLARQFFEIQKAHSGHSINTARFHWVLRVSSTAAKQYFEERSALTPERKVDLLLALQEGTGLLNNLEGPRLIRLQQSLAILQFVIEAIN